MSTTTTVELPRSLTRRLLWFRQHEDDSLVDVIRRLADEHVDAIPQEHPDFERAVWGSQKLHIWMVMFIVDHYPRTRLWVNRRELAFGAPAKFAAITSMGIRRPSLSLVVRGTPEHFRDRRGWLREARPGWSRFSFSEPGDLDYAWYLVRQAHRAVRRDAQSQARATEQTAGLLGVA